MFNYPLKEFITEEEAKNWIKHNQTSSVQRNSVHYCIQLPPFIAYYLVSWNFINLCVFKAYVYVVWNTV